MIEFPSSYEVTPFLALAKLSLPRWAKHKKNTILTKKTL